MSRLWSLSGGPLSPDLMMMTDDVMQPLLLRSTIVNLHRLARGETGRAIMKQVGPVGPVRARGGGGCRVADAIASLRTSESFQRAGVEKGKGGGDGGDEKEGGAEGWGANALWCMCVGGLGW